ncbi:hypothetical protein SUGI_0005550 [Cryptomeria japonica]|uniref:transcription factor bHLH79 isoform X2 n=1 Tax=Cryptomeria japonica TaxID=3369 RepID=UPI002408AAD4|nr:transcription factor bHLH79 isoform X2 [Cryptomeria japonica]GLJ04879.1 hypothetical protein SUGI_0005550 [Cryptomeria japonica]
MALQGNGNYVFDEPANYNSSLDYPASTWQTGIAANYAMKMSQTPPQPTAAAAPTEGFLRHVNSSYGLDELLPFSLHSLDYSSRENSLQNVKLASEQSPTSNFFSPISLSKGNVSAEESSSSEQSNADPRSKICARKRKILPNDKARGDLSIGPCPGENTEESKGKRSKIAEGTNEKPDLKSEGELGANGSEPEMNRKDSQQNSKPSEAPKDYIHVRARRGQATDSHSLAERVRREKISERMKLLQDLVPGCNKITGKAVMLDEIINYVQSLQHQVEFLSMKLEAVNPRLDFNMERFISKDMHEPSSMPFASDSALTYPQFPHSEWTQMQTGLSCNIVEPSLGNTREQALKKTINEHLAPAEGCGDANSQIPNLWDDELQSVVQLGLGQNIQLPFTPQRFQGSFSTSYRNIEY